MTMEVDTFTDDGATVVPVVIDPEARARAEERLGKLQRSFSEVIITVAEMHRDKDWMFLSREDGTPYTSLAALLADALNVSSSMARRYVQGARDVYLPLEQITVDGTVIPITSGDIASLGAAGIADVISTAGERLAGVTDPDESSEIIADSIADAKARRSGPADPAEGWDDPSEFADGDGGYAPEKLGHVPPPQFGGGDEDFQDAMDDLPPLTNKIDPLRDPYEAILDGAERFATPAAAERLPEQLREMNTSLRALLALDPVEVAAMIGPDERGLVSVLNETVGALRRIQTGVESSGWFLERME